MQDILDFMNSNRNLYKKIIYLTIIILAYLAGDKQLASEIYKKFSINQPNQIVSNSQIYFLGKYTISFVVDGDTFRAIDEAGKEDIVRIMAVDTLEMKDLDALKLCLAKKQKDFTKMNLGGKQVFLYADKTQGERDKYNRILAYVATSAQVVSNNIDYNYFYNDYLVETGNAQTYKARPPAILWERFEAKKKVAEKNMVGMWSGKCN
jgi:micrococcal nuclease